MPSDRATLWIVLGLGALNLVLMLARVFPYDLLFAAHARVGLSYSLLMVVAVGAMTLAQSALVIALRKAITGRRLAPPAPPREPGAIWLPHHDVHARALKLNLRARSLSEGARAEAPTLSRGYYVPVENGFAGLYASPLGPVFFLDDRHIPLGPEARASVKPGRRRNVFQLRAGPEVLQISYVPPSDVDIGDLDAGAFYKDFFEWLADSLPDAEFHPWFTYP